jgi:ribosomal protein S18 acetylase RimI-like enzyme
MAIEIVQLTPANIDLLSNVGEEVFDHDIVPAQAMAYTSAPGHMMVVALDGDVVVGQIAGVIHHGIDRPSELYIDNLGVEPSHQRRGIARSLLDQLVAIGKAEGCVEAWVLTETDNEPARGLYSTRGESSLPAMYIMEL